MSKKLAKALEAQFLMLAKHAKKRASDAVEDEHLRTDELCKLTDTMVNLAEALDGYGGFSSKVVGEMRELDDEGE